VVRRLLRQRSALPSWAHHTRARTPPIEDECAARPAQRLVRGGGDDVRVLKGADGDDGRGHQAADVGHVGHEVGAHLQGGRAGGSMAAAATQGTEGWLAHSARLGAAALEVTQSAGSLIPQAQGCMQSRAPTLSQMARTRL